jgi:hypothetical protein
MTRARDVSNIDGILTTKGDIYAATAAATPSRLGVGTNGQVLTAASGQATGLQWATPAAGALTSLYTSAMSGLATITTSTLAGTYKQLWIEVTGARKASGNINLRFNGDTGSNYYRIGFTDSNWNVIGSWTNAAFVFVGQHQASDKDVYTFSPVFNYATSNGIKWAQNIGASQSSGATNPAMYTGHYYWNSSSAITSVTIYTSDSANWTAGTFTVWGLN